MGKIRIVVRPPLFERLQIIAGDEGMPVQELVDFILRAFTEQYDFDDSEIESESEQEVSDGIGDAGSQDGES